MAELHHLQLTLAITPRSRGIRPVPRKAYTIRSSVMLLLVLLFGNTDAVPLRARLCARL